MIEVVPHQTGQYEQAIDMIQNRFDPGLVLLTLRLQPRKHLAELGHGRFQMSMVISCLLEAWHVASYHIDEHRIFFQQRELGLAAFLEFRLLSLGPKLLQKINRLIEIFPHLFDSVALAPDDAVRIRTATAVR
jgi:hypothetical protein